MQYKLSIQDYCAKSKGENRDDLTLGKHIITTLERLEEIFSCRTNDQFSDEKIFKNAAKALILHDLGKVSPDFQRKIEPNIKIDNFDKTEQEKIKSYKEEIKKSVTGFNDCGIKDHEILSVLWSFIVLDNESDDQKIRTAVMYHHYNEFYAGQRNLREAMSQNSDSFKEYVIFLEQINSQFPEYLSSLKKTGDWAQPIKKAIEELLQSYEKNKGKINQIKESLTTAENISAYCKLYAPGHNSVEKVALNNEDYSFFVLLGLLHRADHAGSSTEISLKMKAPSEVLGKVETSFKKSLAERNIPEEQIWQNEALEQASSSQAIVLVAPTGSGKTEFALMWGKKQNRQLIYTLPLRVALDDLYSKRMKKNYLSNENHFDDCVSLLHSTSYSAYLQGEQQNKNNTIEKKIKESRSFKAPLIFSTIDQVMLSSLYYYQFDILFSLYAQATVVIDEIQAYTPEMMAIIINTIEHILKIGGRLLIITATFPPYLKRFLEEPKFKVLDLATNPINNLKNAKNKRHKVEIRSHALIESGEKGDFAVSPDFLDEIKQLYEERKQVLIIVNTVKRAIGLYKEIESRLSNDCFILHSRMVNHVKEKTLQDIALKTRIENGEVIEKKPLVLVATQIVEASVDIDFDILYTELSPIDSQIQRWGRVFRNRKENDYPGEGPNVIIFEEQDSEVNKIYSTAILTATAKVLKSAPKRALSFEDELELLRLTFNEKADDKIDKTICQQYVDEIKKCQMYFRQFTAVKRSEAQRLFRSLATKTIVVPELLKEQNQDIYDLLDESWGEKSWIEILKELGKEESANAKFEVKKILLDNSVSLPIGLKPHTIEFKGFDVLAKGTLKEPKDVENLRKYGADEIAAVIKSLKDSEGFESII